jgi:prophage antirepressor-like protein
MKLDLDVIRKCNLTLPEDGPAKAFDTTVALLQARMDLFDVLEELESTRDALRAIAELAPRCREGSCGDDFDDGPGERRLATYVCDWYGVVIREAGTPGWAYTYEDDPEHLESCSPSFLRRPSNFRMAGEAPARPLPVVELRSVPAGAVADVVVRQAPVPKLPPAVEPIVSTPEEMGVRVYIFRGRLCVIAAAVGRALGYADDGKKLVDSIRDKWAAEMIDGKDVATLRADDLREFKALLDGSPDRREASKTSQLTILYESGWDIVCIKTDKPEGVRLRRALADKVLPRMRRGEPVGAAPPPLSSTDAKLDKILDAFASMAQLMGKFIGQGQAPAAAEPVRVAPPASDIGPGVRRLVPRSWSGEHWIAAMISDRHGQTVSTRSVNKAIKALKVRARPDVAVEEWVQKVSPAGKTFPVPFWRYAPPVIDEIDAHLFPGVRGAPPQQKIPGTDTET